MSTTEVATQWPVVAWPTGITGVGTIFISGTTIDASLLSTVESAATAAGVGITVGTPPTPADAASLTKGQADVLYDPLGAAERLGSTVDGGTP